MKNILEPPIGIILTVPKRFFEETGYTYAAFEKDFMNVMDREDGIWNFLKKQLPTRDFLYVYLVFDGFVQLRCNLLDMQRNESKRFGDNGKIRSFAKKNWIRLCGPAEKAPIDIPMKGFQGFRYVTKELW